MVTAESKPEGTLRPLTDQPFALGTIQQQPGDKYAEAARTLTAAIIALVRSQGMEGTWGGPDRIDRHEATHHTVSTLLLTGVQPESGLLRRAIDYLVDTKTDDITTFFWRAGTLLNIPQYEDLVTRDLAYLWSNRRKWPGWPEYPALLFLLKCVRFSESVAVYPAAPEEIIDAVLAEWDPDECWFNRTSLTSMAFALIADEEFEGKDQIMSRCEEYLLSHLSMRADNRYGLNDNLIDDCYTIYNLCEVPGVLDKHPSLALVVDEIVSSVLRVQDSGGNWSCLTAPFGPRSITPAVVPTAVAVRACAAYFQRLNSGFLSRLSVEVMGQALLDSAPRAPV